MDKRYESIRFMIETGHITEFRQIFNYMPKSPLGKHLHTNNPRITRLTKDVDDLTVQEIVSISSFFGVDYMKMVQLVFSQYLERQKDQIKILLRQHVCLVKVLLHPIDSREPGGEWAILLC